jgi:hypothetical protein
MYSILSEISCCNYLVRHLKNAIITRLTPPIGLLSWLMTYECLTHWRDHAAFYEHRLNGVRLVITNQAEADRLVLVPNQGGEWTSWQLEKLIELNLLDHTGEPFTSPPASVIWKPPPSFCFVHTDFVTVPGFMRLLDQWFDGDPPRGYCFSTFSDEIMAHLVHRAGAFDSISNARRNGWNKPVPPGFSHQLITKRRISVTILNRYDGMEGSDDE